MMKRLFLLMILGVTSVLCLNAQTKSLHQLQQEFVDLRCGMFIHFNMPTFFNEDWPDPDAAPELFNPVRMDCKQWAKAAKSANMTYGCLTTKHHSGFCIWDTKTTDNSEMSSPFKRDVVKEALFYTDIKSYEQGAGQHISKDTNRLPALSCLPLQQNWFWKESFPTTPVKSPAQMVNDNIIPMGKSYCNFILNVAPNRDGLMDANALKALKEIGKLWKNDGRVATVPEADAPIISSNIAKYQPAEGTWSSDYAIMDFANDDDFGTCWNSNPEVKVPWYSVTFEREKSFNMVVITDRNNDRLQEYRLEYRAGGTWKPLYEGKAPTGLRVKIHRFDTVWGDAVRMTVLNSNGTTSIAEFGVYCERR